MPAVKLALGTEMGTASCGTEGGSSHLVDVVCTVAGVGFTSQLKGLANGCKRVRDCLNSDLSSETECTCPDPCSKGLGKDVLL